MALQTPPSSSIAPRPPDPLAARRVALAGAAAAGPGLLALVLGSLVLSGAGFIETVADGATAYIPVDVFRTGLETFGPLAKGLLHLGVAAGIVVAGRARCLRSRLFGSRGPRAGSGRASASGSPASCWPS
jgi:hypothetical protein